MNVQRLIFVTLEELQMRAWRLTEGFGIAWLPRTRHFQLPLGPVFDLRRHFLEAGQQHICKHFLLLRLRYVLVVVVGRSKVHITKIIGENFVYLLAYVLPFHHSESQLLLNQLELSLVKGVGSRSTELLGHLVVSIEVIIDAFDHLLEIGLAMVSVGIYVHALLADDFVYVSPYAIWSPRRQEKFLVSLEKCIKFITISLPSKPALGNKSFAVL